MHYILDQVFDEALPVLMVFVADHDPPAGEEVFEPAVAQAVGEGVFGGGGAFTLVARLLDGEGMGEVCRAFGICHKTAARSSAAYKDQVVKQAEGEAARFTSIYGQYVKAPEVTRERIYIETMERVLGGTDKLIYDGGKSGQGILPYLPLGELTTRRPPAPGGSQPSQNGSTR